jgi:hypothetical protein
LGFSENPDYDHIIGQLNAHLDEISPDKINAFDWCKQAPNQLKSNNKLLIENEGKILELSRRSKSKMESPPPMPTSNDRDKGRYDLMA